MSAEAGAIDGAHISPRQEMPWDLVGAETWDLTYDQRLDLLQGLHADGWSRLPYRAYTETLRAIAATGLRIDTLERVWYRDPKRDPYGTAAANYVDDMRAIFVREPFFYHSAKDRQDGAAHEVGHHNSVSDPDNAYIFGGEAERVVAMESVAAIAEQALESDIYLSEYHRLWARRLHAKKANRQQFYEETWAILCEYASAGQFAELEDISRAQAEQTGAQHVLMKLSAEGDEPNAFTRLFTRGLIYGVHDVATLTSFSEYRRKKMEALDTPEANSNLYYAPTRRRILGWFAVQRTLITGL